MTDGSPGSRQLDLERTLISDANTAHYPRLGLAEFLAFCHERFPRVVLFTTVEEPDAQAVLDELVESGHVPEAFAERLEYVSWCGEYKDLAFVPNTTPEEVLLVDDDAGWIRPDQRDRWIAILPWDGGSGPDRRWLRVQQRLSSNGSKLTRVNLDRQTTPRSAKIDPQHVLTGERPGFVPNLRARAVESADQHGLRLWTDDPDQFSRRRTSGRYYATFALDLLVGLIRRTTSTAMSEGNLDVVRRAFRRPANAPAATKAASGIRTCFGLVSGKHWKPVCDGYARPSLFGRMKMLKYVTSRPPISSDFAPIGFSCGRPSISS